MIDVKLLSGALGAEINGIDLTDVSDENFEQVLHVIQDKAKTGKIGDGKIFVYDLNRVIRIRTGEIDENAL